MEFNSNNLSVNNDNQESINNNKDNNDTIQNDKKQQQEKKNNELKALYQSFMETFAQKQYRKIFSEINLMPEDVLKFDEADLVFFHLKTITLQKIILAKYSHNYNNPQQLQNSSNLFQEENNFINGWLKYIKALPSNKNNKKFTFIEIVITFLLQKCLMRSRFCIREHFLDDAIAFLSLGEKLIEKTCIFFTSPEIFHLASNIYLHLSSFLIAQNNFTTAQFYIAHLLKYAYVGLELRLTNIKQVKTIYNLLEFDSFEYEKILEIFNIISIGFYHLGICYENLEDNYMALELYQQSKWFANIIKENKNYENFFNMLVELNKRELMRNKIIMFFDKYKEKDIVNDKSIKNNVIKLQNPKFLEKEKMKKIKYMKLVEYIKNMKFIEADDDEPSLFNNINSKPLSETVKNSTKNIKLLNYLLSDDFKEFVSNLKKLEINKLNKDTAVKIQKKITEIKKEEKDANFKTYNINKDVELKNSVNQKKLEIINTTDNNRNSKRITRTHISCNSCKNFNRLDEPKQSSKSTKSIKLNNYLRSLNSAKLSKNLSPRISSKQIPIIGRNSINKKYNKNTYYNTIDNSNNKNIACSKNFNIHSLKNRSMSKKEYPLISNRIPKYIFNKYYLSKKYNTKRQILEKQYEREIKFQRQQLKNKFSIYEKVNVPQFNEKECYKQSQEFYENTLEFKLMSENEAEEFKLKNKLKELKELKSKTLKELKSEEYELKFTEDNKKTYYKNEKEISKINLKSIDQISNYINYLNTDIDKLIKKKYYSVNVNNKRKTYK